LQVFINFAKQQTDNLINERAFSPEDSNQPENLLNEADLAETVVGIV